MRMDRDRTGPSSLRCHLPSMGRLAVRRTRVASGQWRYAATAVPASCKGQRPTTTVPTIIPRTSTAAHTLSGGAPRRCVLPLGVGIPDVGVPAPFVAAPLPDHDELGR